MYYKNEKLILIPIHKIQTSFLYPEYFFHRRSFLLLHFWHSLKKKCFMPWKEQRRKSNNKLNGNVKVLRKFDLKFNLSCNVNLFKMIADSEPTFVSKNISKMSSYSYLRQDKIRHINNLRFLIDSFKLEHR